MVGWRECVGRDEGDGDGGGVLEDVCVCVFCVGGGEYREGIGRDGSACELERPFLVSRLPEELIDFI